jgi:translation initiation factor IF-2
MPAEKEKKKHKLMDIAEELQVSLGDIRGFVEGLGYKTTNATKVTDSVMEQILEHYSDEVERHELYKKLKAQKDKKIQQLESKGKTDSLAADPVNKSVPKAESNFSGLKSDEDITKQAQNIPTPEIKTKSEPSQAEQEANKQESVASEPESTTAESGESPQVTSESDPQTGTETTEAVSEPQSAEVDSRPESQTQEPEPEASATENTADVPKEVAESPKEEQPEQDAPVQEPSSESVSESVKATEPETQQDPEPKDERSELQVEIDRQQSEITNRFSEASNVAGLKVLGNIDLQKKKKKRKKNFREQAKDLNQELGTKTAIPGSADDDRDAAEKSKDKAKKSSKKAKSDGSSETAEERPASKSSKRKAKKQVDEKVVERNIRQTMQTMDETNDTSSRQKYKKIRRKERLEEQKMEQAAQEAENLILKITEFASTHEFADMLGVTSKEVIEKSFKLGKFITINQRLDKETIELLALEYNCEVQFISDVEATEIDEEEDDPVDLSTRHPVVTIMGHVDHGKTSLLDFIRNSNVVAGESGGITQHMGAYEVTLDSGQKITFLDTPGHEAFTAMRARGAQVTDVVIIVVAADDNVMPQTVEAINHAKAAEVPLIVAINKIDKPEANPDKIKTQLSEIGVMIEEWGGSVQSQEISAKKGDGVSDLLDKVLIESELLELKANFNSDKLAKGVVIEAELDKGKGVIASVLVQNGVLKVGESFVAGSCSGRVRAMLDERGKRLKKAVPSQPVRILGFEELPQAGDMFSVSPNDRMARDIAQQRKLIRREHEFRHSSRVKLNDIAKQVQEGKVQELRVIIKADTDGSIQALADGLMKVQTPEVKVEIIHRGVGQITETDVLLAAASDAIIIGFRVRPNLNAKKLAEKEEIDIRFYNVIYHVLEDIHDALEGMLSPELSEKVIGTVEIREVFRISKIGNVGGCYVLDGKINRDNRVRLLRDGIQIFEGYLDSLKRFKDDTKEVDTGFECGITIKGYDDIKVGDVIEAIETVETKRKLVVE